MHHLKASYRFGEYGKFREIGPDLAKIPHLPMLCRLYYLHPKLRSPQAGTTGRYCLPKSLVSFQMCEHPPGCTYALPRGLNFLAYSHYIKNKSGRQFLAGDVFLLSGNVAGLSPILHEMASPLRPARGEPRELSAS